VTARSYNMAFTFMLVLVSLFQLNVVSGVQLDVNSAEVQTLLHEFYYPTTGLRSSFLHLNSAQKWTSANTPNEYQFSFTSTFNDGSCVVTIEVDLQNGINTIVNPSTCKRLFVETSITCDGQLGSGSGGVTLTCPNSYTLEIVYVNYGRTSASRCSWNEGPGADEVLDCRSEPSVKEFILGACENKTTCGPIHLSDINPEDPCPGTTKYLEIQYMCQPPVCDCGWTISEEFGCYRLFNANVKFSSAEAICESSLSGATLVAVHTSNQTQVVGNLASDIEKQIWVGGRVPANSSNVQWSYPHTQNDTEPYVNWTAGEPETKAQDTCVVVKKNGTWKKTKCEREKPFLCRKPRLPLQAPWLT